MNKLSNKYRQIIGGVVIVLILGLLIFFYSQHHIQCTRTQYTRTQSSDTTTTLVPQTYQQEITGNIITLKKLTREHAFDVYKMFSPKVRQFLEFPKEVTFGYVEFHVNYYIEKMNENSRIVYSIFDNTVNRLIGLIQIREKNDEDPGQLSMWINENYWGGGRIQEALLLISKAYFKVRSKTNDYIAYVRPWNPRSFKTLLKFGFEKIGETTFSGETANIYQVTRQTVESK